MTGAVALAARQGLVANISSSSELQSRCLKESHICCNGLKWWPYRRKQSRFRVTEEAIRRKELCKNQAFGIGCEVQNKGPSRSWSPPNAVQASSADKRANLRTCRQCKQQYDPNENHPRACRYHTAHYGGETKRKFESVYEGGTLTTLNGGEITSYWHCCGVKDPTDPGCEAAPHKSYDD